MNIWKILRAQGTFSNHEVGQSFHIKETINFLRYTHNCCSDKKRSAKENVVKV